jgi:hypothetical protein
MTRILQVSVSLTPTQLAKIDKRLAKKKKADVFTKKSDVIREIVDAGLQALGEK